MKRVAIVAGESSGDLLGAALIRAVRGRFPDVEFYGIAGPRMIGEGARTLFPMEKLSVRGYVEALKHLPEIFGIRRKLGAQLIEDRPDLFIGIDAPDFNLGLEKRLKSAGIRTVHYVGPSLWAWRPERIHAISRAVDHMLVLFPFEEAIYRKAGVPVSYVGHPLADQLPLKPDRDDARAQLRLPAHLTAIALLPGSRQSELQFHADLLIRTARNLNKVRPEIRFFVPLATRETHAYFESRLYALDARDLPISTLFGHATLALHAADAAIVASGTATLEAALARCPMVIMYRIPALTFWMMKRKALLPYVGLPNILAGEFVVPEFLQEEASPENLAQALGNWLDAKDARQRLRERFAELHHSLACDHDARVADALQPYLDEGECAMTRPKVAAGPLQCGVDEAGRGPLAGSVFAAAVMLDPAKPIRGLADSKILTALVREKLAKRIQKRALAWAVAFATVEEIDRINILRASLLAMRRAIELLPVAPEEVFVDGLHVPECAYKCRAIVDGDQLVAAISAASILAKVARDAEMVTLDSQYPNYGFANHKGYATPEHLAALKAFGPCEIHRKSFEPVYSRLQPEFPF